MTIDPKDEKIQDGELTDDQADRVAGGITQEETDNSNISHNDLHRMRPGE